MFSGINGTAYIARGSVDPSVGAGISAQVASLYLRDNAGAGELWLKTGPLDTDWSAHNDPSVPASSTLYFDGTASNGDFAAPAGSRTIAGRWAPGTNRTTITHPDITANSRVTVSYEGNLVSTPRATRRIAGVATTGPQRIEVDPSSAAIADDGDFLVVIEVL
jgi:hypothetical protein